MARRSTCSPPARTASRPRPARSPIDRALRPRHADGARRRASTRSPSPSPSTATSLADAPRRRIQRSSTTSRATTRRSASPSPPRRRPRPGARRRSRAHAAASELERARRATATRTDAPLSLALPPSLDDELDGRRRAAAPASRGALEHGELLALPDLTLDPSPRSPPTGSTRSAARSAAARTRSPTRSPASERAPLGVARPRAAQHAPAAAMLRDPLGYRLLVLDEPTYESLPGSIGAYLDPPSPSPSTSATATTMPGCRRQPARRAARPTAPSTPARRPSGRSRSSTELLVTREELGADLRRNVVLATAGFELPDGADRRRPRPSRRGVTRTSDLRTLSRARRHDRHHARRRRTR